MGGRKQRRERAENEREIVVIVVMEEYPLFRRLSFLIYTQNMIEIGDLFYSKELS